MQLLFQSFGPDFGVEGGDPAARGVNMELAIQLVDDQGR